MSTIRSAMTEAPVKRFTKPFTQQESIPEAGIERAVEVMRSGRLHRYNLIEGEISEAAKLEAAYAAYQGAAYCVACTSGGYALHIAMRSAGLEHGDKVLANAYTLAPVPGAIHNAGGRARCWWRSTPSYHIDLDDLRAKAERQVARSSSCSPTCAAISATWRPSVPRSATSFGIVLIEDCAHTMGATLERHPFRQFRTGRLLLSTQTYKHHQFGRRRAADHRRSRSIAAKCRRINSGSYMLYATCHGAIPDESTSFDGSSPRYAPNYSGRMDNLRAAILQCVQLAVSRGSTFERWNDAIPHPGGRACAAAPGLSGWSSATPAKNYRRQSSIQFHADGIWSATASRLFVDRKCGPRRRAQMVRRAAEPRRFHQPLRQLALSRPSRRRCPRRLGLLSIDLRYARAADLLR